MYLGCKDAKVGMSTNEQIRIVKILAKCLSILTFFVAILTLTGCNTSVSGLLNPKGVVAYQERKLFFDTMALMLIVVLPVIIMSFTFVYHYQESHRTRDYKPNWAHSYFLEALWWGIPCVIIVILAIITWVKTHELDPYARIAGHNDKPILIQAIALPWKWLFIYPELNIATVNYVMVPIGAQVEYWITADNVSMSALFIPQLGSQVYAMAGMRTRLHLVANEIGTFEGMNTQFNGEGFSDMHFPVYVVSPEKMQTWITQIKSSSQPLNAEAYNQLLMPSINNKPAFYSGVEPDLFQHVLDAYMNTFGPVHPRTNPTVVTPTMSMPNMIHS